MPYYRGWFDSYVYYGTIDAWTHDGGRIYDYLLPDTRYGFTYPPFAAVCMLPMALLGRPAAVAVGIALNVVASAVVVRLLTGPARWTTYVAAGCLFVILEPVRDTFGLGQVNLALLALVLTDVRRHRFAGVGIGLAAAIKLTPALFIGYLLLARRWRAAGTAVGVAAAATAIGWLVAPGPSRVYWTSAMGDTNRVGSLGYASNQSMQGVLARLGDPGGRTAWALTAIAVLCVWAYRSRRAPDDLTGFALTGTTACLVSPITWIHHLVWLLPALVVLLRAGFRARATVVYVILCSSVVWLWSTDTSGVLGFIGSNAYVWLSLWLLLTLPGDGEGR
jgi:alpha-1,2-mannosyltransferase